MCIRDSTGSGKTEVYLQHIARLRDAGRGAIVLVPEIALTPQLSDRFRARFGDEIAVLHSGLTPRQRFDAWEQIRKGERPIVIGARSAVFAPVPDLGTIVVDEEHDGSFKQEEGVRYHARDVALVRARTLGASVVLGSATPSLESYDNARNGRYVYLELRTRPTPRPLPTVEIVPLSVHRPDGDSMMSALLRDAIRETVDAGEQAIVFLNRRGYTTTLCCEDCGSFQQCPDCSSPSMTYHLDDAEEPYISAGIVLARDPETGKTNLSYHRMMIAGRDRTGILMEKGKHLDGIFAKYVERGADMPVAVIIGVHPLVALGALYSGSADVEEYDVIGGLFEAALDIVPCVSQPDLCVPAGAELILEGVVTHSERIQEGPFGEFTGYGTGLAQTPIFKVSAMTHRHEFLFQDIISGHMEHLVLSIPAIEHRTRKTARAVATTFVDLALPAPLTTVVAIDKADDEEPRRVIEAMLTADIYAKHVIVVDGDVDPADLRQVMAAVALQTQADRKVHIFADQQGTPLDPSCRHEDGTSAKMGIDATRPLAPARTFTRNRLPPELLASIDVKEFKAKRPS